MLAGRYYRGELDELPTRGRPLLELTMKTSIIVCRARNGVIGRENSLPWRLPDDLKKFKRVTMGHHLIMGRKTFESLPGILPGRSPRSASASFALGTPRNSAVGPAPAAGGHKAGDGRRRCQPAGAPAVVTRSGVAKRSTRPRKRAVPQPWGGLTTAGAEATEPETRPTRRH